jgi:hypothetical protein
VVWPICTKGINIQNNFLHGITIWGLRKEKMSREGNSENKKIKKKRTWFIEEEEEEAIAKER